MVAQAGRKRERFTVLQRDEPWKEEEVDALTNELSALVHRHDRFPDILILRGSISVESLDKVLIGDFDHQVVYENSPDMPFAVPEL